MVSAQWTARSDPEVNWPFTRAVRFVSSHPPLRSRRTPAFVLEHSHYSPLLPHALLALLPSHLPLRGTSLPSHACFTAPHACPSGINPKHDVLNQPTHMAADLPSLPRVASMVDHQQATGAAPGHRGPGLRSGGRVPLNFWESSEAPVWQSSDANPWQLLLCFRYLTGRIAPSPYRSLNRPISHRPETPLKPSP